jgi:hypothetical protein
MIASEAYLGEIFRQLARKGPEEVGRERWVRALSAATPDADGRRILEACRLFIYDCLEPPLDRTDLAIAVLAGQAPALVSFQLPPDLRKFRRRRAHGRVSSIRLWLDYHTAFERAKPILTGRRQARQGANLRLTMRERFPEIAAVDLLAPPVPTTPGALALRVVACCYGLKDSTVKRRVNSIPTATVELLVSERLAFALPLDPGVLTELHARVQRSLVQEMRAFTDPAAAVSSTVSS